MCRRCAVLSRSNGRKELRLRGAPVLAMRRRKAPNIRDLIVVDPEGGESFQLVVNGDTFRGGGLPVKMLELLVRLCLVMRRSCS